MKTFVKPSGVEVDVNESSYAKALELGWVPKEELQAVVKQAGDERDVLVARAQELGIKVGRKGNDTLAAEIAEAESAE